MTRKRAFDRVVLYGAEGQNTAMRVVAVYPVTHSKKPASGMNANPQYICQNQSIRPMKKNPTARYSIMGKDAIICFIYQRPMALYR
jgi:hypothetical protein